MPLPTFLPTHPAAHKDRLKKAFYPLNRKKQVPTARNEVFFHIFSSRSKAYLRAYRIRNFFHNAAHATQTDSRSLLSRPSSKYLARPDHLCQKTTFLYLFSTFAPLHFLARRLRCNQSSATFPIDFLHFSLAQQWSL